MTVSFLTKKIKKILGTERLILPYGDRLGVYDVRYVEREQICVAQKVENETVKERILLNGFERSSSGQQAGSSNRERFLRAVSWIGMAQASVNKSDTVCVIWIPKMPSPEESSHTRGMKKIP